MNLLKCILTEMVKKCHKPNFEPKTTKNIFFIPILVFHCMAGSFFAPVYSHLWALVACRYLQTNQQLTVEQLFLKARLKLTLTDFVVTNSIVWDKIYPIGNRSIRVSFVRILNSLLNISLTTSPWIENRINVNKYL